MPDLWTDLLGCLDLKPDSPGSQPDRGADVAGFQGPNQDLSYHRVFGGQILAQFVEAARRTCPDKAVKSLHALFPKEGRAPEPMCYEVRRHHEGRTFATLSIVARQTPGVVATASVSMHAIEDGREHQEIPPPPAIPEAEQQVRLDLLPWETRTTADLNSPAASRPEFDLWMRTPAIGSELAPALTAYATDLSLIGTALRPIQGVGQQDAGKAFTSAVTSHTLWFHRPFRTDTWLLLRQHSPLVAHGRCFGRGDVLTGDGTLVASFAQEALLRFQR